MTDWKSYIDTSSDAIHVMPDANPDHEPTTDCWCRPAVEVMRSGDTSSAFANKVLVSHRLDDGTFE